jgi:hypothetical protein
MSTLAGLLVFAVIGTPVARAQQGVVGGLGSSLEPGIDGVTLVDLTRGASTTGNYTNATIFWTGGNGGSCHSSFTLKFYRPGLLGTGLTFLEERGPFDSQPGLIDVTLSPPVALQTGDVIGLAEIAPAHCGGVAILASGDGVHTARYLGDIGTTSVTLCDDITALLSETIGVVARMSGTEVRVGIVTGVGSVHGAAGSNFKTAMQLVNPGLETIQGHLIFHPAGHPASANDPSIPYSIPGEQMVNFPDVVAAIGQSGLGSIDVKASSSYAPLVVTRVFNDGGAAGTAGFTEPLVRSGDEFVLNAPDQAWLVAPPDLTQFRWNIGIRTLADGASLRVRVFSAGGTLKKTLAVTYSSEQFDQKAAADFLGGVALSANDIVLIEALFGKAILYGVSVDNTTNDTSLQLANRFF